MKLVPAIAVSLLLLASPAMADPDMTAPTEWADRTGHIWQCQDWNDTDGCNTGQEWIDGNGVRHILWVTPEGGHSWHRAEPYHTAPVSTPVPEESAPAYYCPDGSGPYPAR